MLSPAARSTHGVTALIFNASNPTNGRRSFETPSYHAARRSHACTAPMATAMKVIPPTGRHGSSGGFFLLYDVAALSTTDGSAVILDVEDDAEVFAVD